MFYETAGIIGAESIGCELFRQLKKINIKPAFICDSTNIYSDPSKKEVIGKTVDYEGMIHDRMIVFLAIPTLDNGEHAFTYMDRCLDNNVPVITCEKGALGNNFSPLEEAIQERMISYTASVGGGSMLLQFGKEKVLSVTQEVHGVVNGTLNYVLSNFPRNKLENAVLSARELGYTEPGNLNPIDTLNAEITRDVPFKLAILFNTLNLTGKRSRAKIRAAEIPATPINRQDIERLARESRNRRYIISIRKDHVEEDIIAGFEYEIDNFYISGGFKKISSNPLYDKLLMDGPKNGLLVVNGTENNPIHWVTQGIGAGVDATVQVMLWDAKVMEKNKRFNRR